VTDARELIAGIRLELAPLSARVGSHPYIDALGEQGIAREKLRLFAGEQYHIIRNDVRSFAILLARQEDAGTRRFLVGSVEFEQAAFEALFPFAAALGMSETDLDAYEPMPGAHAYTAFLAETAMYASAADMAGAFIVDLEGWGGNCGAMSRALKEGYGFRADQLAFFDHFAAGDPTFEPRSLEVIDRFLNSSSDADAAARSIRRTARLMMSYEVMYWDAMLEASLGE
jgi:pyrroloquinoline quinone (PQQ) biosynthesis protein C